MSYVLRNVIPIMKLLKELNRAGFNIESTMPKVTCKVFVDNSGMLDMVTVHKHRATTEHLNMKLQHFRDYVTHGEVTIISIATLYQELNYLTKAVNQSTLGRYCLNVQG